MECRIRKRRMKDAADFAAVINNKDIQHNLTDGLHIPIRKKTPENLSVRCWLPVKIRSMLLQSRLVIK